MSIFRWTSEVTNIDNKRLALPDKPQLKLEWDDERAKNVYVLYQPKMLVGLYLVDWAWSASAKGDKKWAEKIAQHYDIELPTPGATQ